MNTRERILENIRKNKRESGTLPTVPDFTNAVDDLLDVFFVQANLAGSKVQTIHNITEVNNYISSHFPMADKIVSCQKNITGNFDIENVESPKELNPIDIAIIPSSLGVSENGAVWIDESKSRLRILPFITQHLIVVLPAINIVENMHIAYKRLQIDETGFGVWIAGPSKTADIEQTLVVGAQGARSLSILIMD